MVNSGDTGFVLICAAFVFFMTPGLALFYGGLGRRKNVVNTMFSWGIYCTLGFSWLFTFI